MTRTWLAVISLALIGTVGVPAQQKPVGSIIFNGFEDGEGGWTMFGTGGRLSTTKVAENIHSGTAALRLDYFVNKDKLALLILPTTEAALAKARSFKFWIKADYNAPIGVVLQEREGARYIALFSATSGKWQAVELAPSDFSISDSPNDPKDSNNKLDLDQVESVAIVDLAQIFTQGSEDMAAIFGVKLGDHTMYLDDFTVSSDPLPIQAPPSDGSLRIDGYQRPQVMWFSIGDMKLSMVSDGPLTGKSLSIAYRQAAGKMQGFGRGIKTGSMAGMTGVRFSAASKEPAKLMLQVEENSGGKYNIMFELTGDKKSKDVELKFADFKVADDSKDNNGKLDLDQIKQMMIIDLTGALDQVTRDNSLWLGQVLAFGKP